MAENQEGSEAPLRLHRESLSESNHWQAHGGISQAKRLSTSRKQPKGHWCQETASLALLKAAHVGFIFRNPTCHLLAGEFSRFRHLDSLTSQPGGKKQHQLLFLFRRQSFRRRLNFIKFAHIVKISRQEQCDNYSILIRKDYD
jgi:hypothetical protein